MKRKRQELTNGTNIDFFFLKKKNRQYEIYDKINL